MALVNNQEDDAFDPKRSDVSANYNGKHSFTAADEHKNDQTHEGWVGGKIKLRFPFSPASLIKKSILKHKASAKVIVIYLAKDGTSAKTLPIALGENLFRAKEIYSPLGIELKFDSRIKSLPESLHDEIFGDNNFEVNRLTDDMKKLLGFFEINWKEVADAPTIFYVPSEINNGRHKGIATNKLGVEGTGIAYVSLTDSTPNTFAHELGHLLGLADNPVSVLSDGVSHNHEDGLHYLMARYGPYAKNPLDCGKRFTEREELWLLAPRGDRQLSFRHSQRYVHRKK